MNPFVRKQKFKKISNVKSVKSWLTSPKLVKMIATLFSVFLVFKNIFKEISNVLYAK